MSYVGLLISVDCCSLKILGEGSADNAVARNLGIARGYQ